MAEQREGRRAEEPCGLPNQSFFSSRCQDFPHNMKIDFKLGILCMLDAVEESRSIVVAKGPPLDLRRSRQVLDFVGGAGGVGGAGAGFC